MKKRKKYTVTTYDGFGNVAKVYQANSIGWYSWQCCELDKDIYLNMPAMIIEDNKLEPEWPSIQNADSHPHEITLLSFDNKIIKKWLSNHVPAKRGNWAQFTSDRRSIQIAGCMIIKRIKK